MINISIPTLNKRLSADVQIIIDNKTKPQGSLGLLEPLALQLALIQSQHATTPCQKITLSHPVMLVFAGDHGIADQGVSIAPSEVTTQMVANFINGGAAINCFCHANQIDFYVVDAGIKKELQYSSAKLIKHRLGNGTADFSVHNAMTLAQAQQGLIYGQQVTSEQIVQGMDILLLGEMGIANTSSASALMAALSEYSVEQCVGKGTGINEQQYAHKLQLIKQALTREPKENDTISILARFGGFEIVQIVGAMLEAGRQQIPIVIDGFIVTVAALAAYRLAPQILDYFIFAHQSEEQGHQLLLKEMSAKPLLSLGLRLGEGTGAALALPLIQAACCFYNEMASFESAGVTV
ncbi:nicotinate-nucleotide--dimethylbenzimidazole phosphoribosyltransferase [Psychromonas antarctica]|uniref:nicotinate-nucleotide--dimethylbenzimidazole phosphoribosyltransferase n=1 Tax=Psychromonas antarctica TaxID=67573 RepID=UPI001EE7F8FA|nr:nicotinate-nucleotide--dimethylbenzimidazole phosphoribosyltransferase [Psychromonas antarctica]MCG6202478.1 nicotinate-nucleotide--dimethylbenzimidazole phosphoribosyltransferase [Psychromonas antarctica]